jgi:pyruvate,water dikinase
VPLVGGKNAALGELYRGLSAQGVKVPNGFAITAATYRGFLREAGLDQRITAMLQDLDTRDLAHLRQRGRQVRQEIMVLPCPRPLLRRLLQPMIA